MLKPMLFWRGDTAQLVEEDGDTPLRDLKVDTTLEDAVVLRPDTPAVSIQENQEHSSSKDKD